MKNILFHYTNAELIHVANCMRVTSFNDFYSYLEINQLTNIFYIINNGEEEEFAVMHNNLLLRHPAQGFKKLEDYHTATINQFPDAATFYEAIDAGYKKYDDYKLVHEAGIKEKEELERMKHAGFVKGFEDFIQLQQSDNEVAAINELKTITNAYQLYSFAIQNGFEKYDQFKAALLKGFTDKFVMDAATELGFPDNTIYKEALTLGFRTFQDLQTARTLKVRDHEDWKKLLELKCTGDDSNSYDQRLLLVLLSKLEQGKKISLNKLFDLFHRTLSTYHYPDTEQLPEWFTNEFADKDVLANFITQNIQVKKYGAYDLEGEFFQINQMYDRKVIVDGSNIAHNSNGNANNIPSVSNIILMVNFLKAKGFTDIGIISDASLKKKLSDPEKINELKETVEYLEAPRENPADIFILNYVKNQHCLLVSNDTFREWKIKDSWVAENIDYYRLPFMIKGSEVLIPDLR